MNLLGRFRSIIENLKPGFILMIPVFLGCETSDNPGIQYELDSDANVEFVEFTLPTTSIYIDSLRTDGEDRVIAGTYNDDIGGQISAEGYFAISYESGPLPKETGGSDTLEIDSIIFSLESLESTPLSSQFNQELDIYTLSDSLISSAVYLSGTELSKEELIGSFTKTVNPDDTINVFHSKLSAGFEREFFNTISNIAGDQDLLISTYVFKSFGITSGNSSEGLSLFDLASDTSRIYLYTSPIDTKDTTYVTSFTVGKKNFTYLDRSASIVGGLDDDTEISNIPAVKDPLYGITPKFSINELADFFGANKEIILNNATFTFSFESETPRDTLENFYTFFYANNGYNASGLVSSPFTSLVMSDAAFLQGQSSPALSRINDENTEIIQSATLFFQTLYLDYIETGSFNIPNSEDNPFTEFILLNQNEVSLQRSVFGAEGIKLRIYYTEVN